MFRQVKPLLWPHGQSAQPEDNSVGIYAYCFVPYIQTTPSGLFNYAEYKAKMSPDRITFDSYNSCKAPVFRASRIQPVCK